MAILVLAGVAGCSPPVSTASPDPAGEGALHLTASAHFPVPLRLEYLLGDQGELGDADEFPAEVSIAVDRALPAGPVQVIANGQICAGTIEITPGLEIDAILWMDPESCHIEASGSHVLGHVQHPAPRTAIHAMVPPGTDIEVRRLDGQGGPPIEGLQPDAQGMIEVEVEPGRFEVTVLLNGVILTSEEVELTRGAEFVYNLRVLSPDVPRDCGVLEPDPCEAAVAEAYAWGLLSPEAVVAKVHARPTAVTLCDSSIRPRWDVTFDLDGAPSLVVTVGHLPTGRIAACTW